MENDNDYVELNKGCQRGCAAVIIFTIIALCIVFCTSCATQKKVSTKETIFVADSTKIEKLHDSIRVLNVKINEQNSIVFNLNERLKSQENAKVSEKTTEFDKEGNVTKINEKNIDYSKKIESEKLTSLQQQLDKQVFINDSLQSTYIDKEYAWRQKEYDYREKIDKKTKSQFWLFYLGLLIGCLAAVLLEKYLNNIFSFIKKIFIKS